ncbi:uncharacterized protein LOC111076682 [Drosophila obscura]|uniref:uncharacterized protein LOC111076682 n=1 Tax=Drosophila obscura TaxID=7282 RepID=UPI001BB0DB62|nr:uncharacterized protein LOC111076682 [Drosophila obscura]
MNRITREIPRSKLKMFMVKILKILGFAGTVLFIKELGNSDTASALVDCNQEEPPGAAPIELAKDGSRKILFDEDDKRDLKRKTDDFKRKYCTKGGICEPPPPKPFSESIADAWSDTVRALKKIPAFWGGVASDLGDSICRLFKGDDK